MRANGTVRSAFFHMTGFRNSARGGRRSRTARLVKNLVVEGIDFKTLPIGTKFKCNDVVLELTQIGKECHHGCAIFQAMGDCIMPREGVFTKVLHGGVIKEGDNLEILEEA